MRRNMFAALLALALPACLVMCSNAAGAAPSNYHEIGLADAPAEINIDDFVAADDPVRRLEFWFSTEVGFTTGDSTGSLRHISDGDLLTEHACLVRTNRQLTARLGIMPIAPDLGLDAVSFPMRHNLLTDSADLTNTWPIYFSLEEGVFSETQGWISDGDLLNSDGRIVRTNFELIRGFEPLIMSAAGVGLDAVHMNYLSSPDIGILFSVERNFYSGQMNRLVKHGDLLAESGRIYRTNQQLLRNFRPYVPPDSLDAAPRDYGLDGVYVTRWGEVWFSVEEGFYDRMWGYVSDGDVLSEAGYIVRRNLDLLRVCEPLEDMANFGLDALDYRCPLPSPTLSDVSNSGCKPSLGDSDDGDDVYPFCGGDDFAFRIGAGTVAVVHKNAAYNCCPTDIAVYMSIVGNNILLTEEEILPAPCDCDCCYDIQSKIINLESGTYTLDYCWFDYETGQNMCYNTTITIP